MHVDIWSIKFICKKCHYVVLHQKQRNKRIVISNLDLTKEIRVLLKRKFILRYFNIKPILECPACKKGHSNHHCRCGSKIKWNKCNRNASLCGKPYFEI